MPRLTSEGRDAIVKVLRYSKEIVEYGNILQGLDHKEDAVQIENVLDKIKIYHDLSKQITLSWRDR